MSNSGSVLNLLVLSIAIILIFVILVKNNSDSFNGRVPMSPIGNGGYIPYGVPGQLPNGAPMLYRDQLYPAKVPYINDSVKNVGRPCGEGAGCGAFGSCLNGVCSIKKVDESTVFNMRI